MNTIENNDNMGDTGHTDKRMIVGGLIAVTVLLLAGIFYVVVYKGGEANLPVFNQEVSTADPVDIVLDFYNPWLEAVKSTSTDPYTLNLATHTLLSKDLSERLMSTRERGETDIDPVLCQTTTPTQITGRIVSKTPDNARVLVMAKEKELTAQSVFTLKRHTEGWYIDDILCSPGEFDIPREFSFEQEGYLLKSVPPPLNPEFWHIVFEQNGTKGHAVPLLFDAESSCVSTGKIATICVPEQFTEAVKMHVYGQALESGVQVKRLEFME